MPKLQGPIAPAPLPGILSKAPAVETPGLKPEPKSETQPVPAGDQLKVSPQLQGRAAGSVSLEPEPQFITHKVRRGETLSDIAAKYLGNPNRHAEIYQANRDDLRNPNDLRIGMTLRIPAPAGSKPATEPEPSKPDTEVTPVTTPDKPESAFTQYTVRRGESLSSISLRTLGDSERYMEIYRANRNQLKTPDDLHPGMVLNIPKPAAKPEVKPDSKPETQPAVKPDGKPAVQPVSVDTAGMTAGALELFGAMQRYQEHHAKLGNTDRTKTSPAQLAEIARELDSASQAFKVDPKLMLALFAHESGGIRPGARSHTGAGGLGQLTSIAIRQVHFMAGIGKGNRGQEPYSEHKANFVQSTRSISQRYDIKANVWTSVAYMSYELNERARLGRGVEKALKRYGDPNVSTYANKVNAEYKTLFGGKLF